MKTVVITGGSRGIGFSIVKELISKKYLVINISKDKNISFKNKNLFNYSCDIAKHKDVSLLFDKIYRKHGNFYALINKNPGVIINISSIVGLVSHEKRASYSISKSAINGLTRSIVADYSHLKLRCFSICPGYVETDLTRNFLNKLDKIQKSKLVKKHKLGKLGYPKDVANLVSFLLDSKSSWMTGNILPLDGGYVS